MGNSVLGPAAEASTPKSRAYKILLIVMFCVQLVLAVLAFVVADVTIGIFSLILMLLLFFSWRYLQYTTLMIFGVCSILLYMMALVYVLGK